MCKAALSAAAVLLLIPSTTWSQGLCLEPSRSSDQAGGEILSLKAALTPDYQVTFRVFPNAKDDVGFTLAAASGGAWRPPACTPWIILPDKRQESLAAAKLQGASLVGTFTRASVAQGVAGIWLCGKTIDLGEPLRCGLRKIMGSEVHGDIPAASTVTAVSPPPPRNICESRVGVTREVDRFTGAVSAKAFIQPGLRQYAPMVLWSSEAPDIVFFEMIGSSDTWRYLSCHTLALMADGRRVEGDTSTHRGDVGRGYVIETISTHIPWTQAAPLLNVSNLEFRLCNDEGRVTQDFACQIQSVMKVAAEWRAEHHLDVATPASPSGAGICPPKLQERLKQRGFTDKAISDLCAD